MEDEYSRYVNNKKHEIKNELKRYIESSGINIASNKFSCPNKAGHKFGDRNPSASITEGSDGPYWKCFVCGKGGDTFNFAHLHDGLALNGPEFITITIKTIAEKLGIEWDPLPLMSDAQFEKMKLLRAHERITKQGVYNLCNLIEKQPEHHVTNYITNVRNLTKDDIIKFELCYFKDLEDIRSLFPQSSEIKVITTAQEKIRDLNNIPQSLLTQIHIDPNNKSSRQMFNDDCLIFTLRDTSGNIVGYASRNVKYGTPEYDGPKYINSPNGILFNKSMFLYGLYDALSVARRSDVNNLYLVEGYLDYISCVKHGIENVAALCGTAFSEGKMNLLYTKNINVVTFCLDGDDAGAKATYNTIEKEFMDNKIITPYVIQLPNGDDPDSLLKQEDGDQKFKELKRYNLVEYRIISDFKNAKENLMDNIENAIENFFNWIIQYEPNHIKRLKCIPLLAEQTGYSVQDLRKQIEYQDKMLSDKTIRKIDTIWYEMVRDGKSQTIKGRLEALDRARHNLVELTEQEDTKDIVKEQIETIEFIDNSYQNNTITQVLTGWKLFDEHVLIPKDASVIITGAYPNVGKSIFMRNLALNIISKNSDMGCIYFTLDDPLKQTLPALIANKVKVNINDIRFQNLIPKSKKPQIIQKIQVGFSEIKELISTNKLAIFDQGTVSTIGDIQTYTEIVGEQMARRNIKPFIIIDSLHSIKMENQDRRLEVMTHIRDIRRIANINSIPIFGVAELRKGDSSQGKGYRRAHLRDFSETGDIEYRVTVGMILENQLKEKGIRHTSRYWYNDSIVVGQPLPIVSMHVDKNKEGFFQGEICYKFNPFYSEMIELTEAEVLEIDRTNTNQNQPEQDERNEDSIRLNRASSTRR